MSKVTIEEHSDAIYLKGVIDEFAEFNSLLEISKDKAEVVLDLSGIERINSTGVRQWVNFLKELDSNILYKRCPVAVVEQFNMVPEFLGSDSKVESFYASYYSDDLDEEKYVLIKATDIDPKNPSPPEIICNGHEYEFDGDETEFFHFLIHVK